MWANSGYLFAARVVFPGETPESDSAICLDTSDLRRLLHYRLEVLEAALRELARLQRNAAQGTFAEYSHATRTLLYLRRRYPPHRR